MKESMVRSCVQSQIPYYWGKMTKVYSDNNDTNMNKFEVNLPKMPILSDPSYRNLDEKRASQIPARNKIICTN